MIFFTSWSQAILNVFDRCATNAGGASPCNLSLSSDDKQIVILRDACGIPRDRIAVSVVEDFSDNFVNCKKSSVIIWLDDNDETQCEVAVDVSVWNTWAGEGWPRGRECGDGSSPRDNDLPSVWISDFIWHRITSNTGTLGHRLLRSLDMECYRVRCQRKGEEGYVQKKSLRKA